MKKIILTFIVTLLAGLGSVTAQNVAKIGNQEFSSLADAVAAVQSNYTITLLQNTEVTSMGNIEGKTGVVIELGGHTINLKANNIHVNNGSDVTIQNGTIDITGNNASGDCIIGIGGYNNSANTLTLEQVKIQGDGYSSAYGVLYAYDYNGSVNTINVNQCVVDLKNDASSSGGVFKMGSTKDILNIYNSTITLDKTQRGITTGTVKINSTVFTMTNGDNGIHSSNLTVENSDISITNGSGRGITAGSAPMVINGHSTVTLSGNAEGDLRLDANSSVSVQGESSLSAASIKENGGTIANNITVASTSEMVQTFVAKVGTTSCTTLEAAFTAAEDGQTITLLADCAGNGIIVPQGKFTTGLTVDFDGHTYTVDRDPLAGSTGTESQAFQLLKGNTITFKNGTIYSEKARMLVQNYSNLTLEGMTLTLNNTNYTDPAYTLSNNNGNVVIDGCTINANNDNSYAFDVCRYASYPSVNVTVTGNSIINGDVQIDASNSDAKDGFSLTLESGTLNGDIDITANAAAAMAATPAKASVSKKNTVNQDAPEGYVWSDNGDGTSTLAVAVAKIGDTQYATLAAAINAAADGETIEIIADGPMGDNVTIKNKEITIVGEGVITLNTSTGQEITIGEGGILNVGASDGTSDITFDGENRYYGSLFNIKDGGIVNMYDGVKTENIQINGLVVRLNGESPVFNMYGGSITCSGGAEMGVVAIESGNGVINIEGGTISYSGEDQIYSVLMIANSHGTVNMKGGEIIASDKVFFAVMITDNGDEGYAKFNMTGGTITSLNTTYHYAIAALEGESVTISGGNINGRVEGDDNYDGTIVITGGTFDYDVSPLLVGTEYIASKNEGTPETWTVTMGAATVTDADNNVTNYATLAEAFTAANAASGSTLTLLNDIEVTNDDLNGVTDTPPYLVTGKFTLDLNGKTIEYTGTSTLTTGVIGVKRGGDLVVDDSSDPSTGEINSGAKAYAAIAVTVKGEAATGDAAKLTVNGGTITGDYYAITGNGSRHDTEITINGGVIKGNHEGDNLGIYHPQDGKLTITDGEISGYSSAIEVRSGELTITGGTFTVESTSYSCNPNGNGTTTKGAAIAIAQHTTNKPITATITGGTFNVAESENTVMLSVQNPQANAFDNVTVTRQTGLMDSNNIPEGYSWYDNGDNTLSLVPPYVSVTNGETTTKHATLQSAFEAAENAAVITLLQDITLDEDITVPEEETDGLTLILNLDDKTITGDGKIQLQARVNITTDTQLTDLFTSAVEGETVLETANEDGTYTYIVGNDVYWSWTDGDGRTGFYDYFHSPFDSGNTTGTDEMVELQRNVTMTEDIICGRVSGTLGLKFGDYTVNANGYHVKLPAPANGARAMVPSDEGGVTIYTDKLTDIFAAAESGYTILVAPSDDPDYAYAYQVVEADDENAIARNKQTGILYSDLQLAVDLANAGNTIELLPGIENVTIDETVTIKKNLTIEGQGDEGDNLQVTSNAKVAFEVTGPGSVTFNKVDIYAQYYDPEGAENHMKSGSRAIKVDEQFGDSLVINYSTIQSTGRGIDVYDVNGGFVLDVKHSNIEAILQDGDEATAGYINSFDTDPDGRGRGINFSHKAASIVANIQFSKIQGYGYPIHVWNESGKVELNMTDCSTWGRNIINNEGDNSTFNLKNVTSHSYNNEDSGDNEAFAAIVDYKTADLNFYNIEDLKVVAVVKAADIDPTSATQNFIDLRGTNATVKITGNSGYVTSDTDTNLSKEIRDRVGFVNKLIIADDVEVGESDAYKRMIDKTVNNRIYFDDESKSYFNFWFEIMEPFEYDYDNDTEDELIRIAIADKTDYTNLYPVVPLEVKVRMTIMSEDSGEPVVLYYGNLEDAFNSELFGSAAEIQLLSDVELDEDITVRLERGEDFTLTLINDGGDVCAVNVSNDASIKLPPLVYAYCNEAQGATLFTSADETLAVIKGANNGVSGLIKYYVPANVYYADTKEKAVGNPDDDEYEPNIDGGLLWIFKDLLSTDADAMLQITPDCYVRLEADVTLDETYTLPIGGDVDNEEVFYLDLNGKTIDGEYKSLVMRLGTAIYTTGTIDIFSSIDPEYTVVYDVLDTPIETTYTDFEGETQNVSFTHKYYLMKDGLAVIVDPSTYCGDRLTPNFIVKKKVVDADTGEESWVVLEDETDYTWSLVPPASDDADDKTYIDAKTYVQAIVIEGITFQGTRKADFIINPRDIKDVTASGNEQPWRAEGYTPEDIKNLIELQYFCTTHADPANPVLVRDVDYRISVVGENAAQSAINYTYPASTPYTYKGTFVQADATTVDYYITPDNASVAKNLVGDVARFLGALYRASGVTSITYDGVTYSWSTEPDELKGSNWRDDDNHTLVSVIASQFSPTNMPASLTITTDKGDITVNINVTDDPAPAPASTGMYLDVDTYPQVITITAIEGGNYTGTLKLDFTILPEDMIDISKCMVISDATYTSAPLPPTENRIAVIYKQTAMVADVPTEQELILPADAYTIEVHGSPDSYVDAKTYSNAITIVANPDVEVSGLRFYGTLDADYVIKQRDLADDSADPSENDNEGIVTLNAYAGADKPATTPKTIYLKWTGEALVPVINADDPEDAEDDEITNNINLILNAKEDPNAEDPTAAPGDVEWKLIPADYSYTIEPAPMVDPGIYKVIFTGRGNFTGMREVNVMVLKDINMDGIVAEVPLQVIPNNDQLKPSELKDVVIKDGNTVLEEGVHYEIIVKGQSGTIYDDANPIMNNGLYDAYFKGLEPYYFKQNMVDNFPVLFEYNSYDLSKNGTDYYNTYSTGYLLNSDKPVSIHVTSGKNMECQVGDMPGTTAIDPTKEDITLPGVAAFKLGTEADNALFNLKVVGIDDNAFMGCNNLHWVDATDIAGYTPDNLSRTSDGPFNGYPVQSLVYLDGTKGGDVTGTNYIYVKSADDETQNLCEELKIYDDLKGDQQQIRENEGTYVWDFRNIYPFTADKVTNTRYFTGGQHYTTCLPYKLQMPAGMKVYTLDAASDNIFGFKELSLSELDQFTPYLLIPSKGGNLLNNEESTVVYVTPTADQGQLTPKDTPTHHIMYGTNIYMDNDAAAGMYIMQSKNTWMKIDAGSSYNGACILPMRAYIQLPAGSGGSREFITSHFTDAIESLNAEVNDDWTNAEVYDLQGRKVDTTARLPKGVYIVNGQKRIRK